MAKLAVDIVLLPSLEMMKIAIEANMLLLRDYKGGIALNTENCLPHVSLAMGCIDEQAVCNVTGILQSLADCHRIDNLKIAGIHIGTNSIGQRVYSIKIVRDQAIQALHEDVMAQFETHLRYDVTPDMLVNPNEVEKSTLLWIESYKEKSSFENFSPHITLGYGQLENFPLPDSFTASKLALCHLGNHCTCRRILAAIDMN